MKLPKKILIVEDEVITQRYLINILEDGGADIIECFNNANDVLFIMKEKEYDLILMDINIKGAMDGIQLAKTILQIYQLPIVFVSAYNDNETLDDVLELSPFGFITKPFSSNEVIASLKVAYKRFLTVQEKQKFKNSNVITITQHYTYSQNTKTLYRDNVLIKLNAKQNKMIEILVKNINNVVSYDEFTQEIWGINDITASALRTLVYSIRKELPDFPLHTHSKIGYYLKREQ